MAANWSVDPEARIQFAQVRLWDMATNRQLICGSKVTMTDCVLSVATVGDKIASLLGSADSTVRTWDMSTGAKLLQMNGLCGWVWSV